MAQGSRVFPYGMFQKKVQHFRAETEKKSLEYH